jgi:glutathione peroxidase-family protein
VREFVTGKSLPVDGGGVVLMSKVNVNGAKADPAWVLAKDAFPGEVSWNFAGVFTFDKEGLPTGRFDSKKLAEAGAALTGAL